MPSFGKLDCESGERFGKFDHDRPECDRDDTVVVGAHVGGSQLNDTGEWLRVEDSKHA